MRPKCHVLVNTLDGGDSSQKVLEKPEAQKNDGGYLNRKDEEEQEPDLGIITAVKINPHDAGDRAGGTEGRDHKLVSHPQPGHRAVDEPCGDPRKKVEEEILFPADLVFHVYPEDPEKHRVA